MLDDLDLKVNLVRTVIPVLLVFQAHREVLVNAEELVRTDSAVNLVLLV